MSQLVAVWNEKCRIGSSGFVLLAILGVVVLGCYRWGRDYENLEVNLIAIAIPTVEATVACDMDVATSRNCGNSHGDYQAEEYLINEPVSAVMLALNLKVGAGNRANRLMY